MEIAREKLQSSVVVADGADPKSCYMQKFRLYETRSRFYMIGRDKNRTFWRVLKIDRLEPSELNIIEDSTVYSEIECCDLLRRIHEGNKSTGGLKFVTTCYGIIGFIKFLEPYYMLLITKRRKIGTICGHTIYAITKSEMVPIPHATVRSKMAYSKDENRYLKRGVNEKGRVANDVETEQIVFTDARDGCPMQISSVVQIRGSIPLFWSQEASPLNIKPDIILSRKDSSFEATRLHFENLVKRYGNPIIILNLIKTREKKPRETILRAEFANAVRSINKNLKGENRLRFLHWDLHRHSRCKATNVLGQLGKVAAYALKLTGIFYCPMTLNSGHEGLLQSSYSENNNASDHSVVEQASMNKDIVDKETKVSNCYYSGNENKDYNVKPQMLQAGVLRTNCIDCLDRTNVAQYAYGLAALGRQLQVLGFIESPYIDLDNPLAKELMAVYESMGDTLAFQYGGSAAHNKIFSERRGQWKAATQSQEFIRTLQRYYNNTYLDGDKQKTINIFLGHFQPQQGKPALWELDSDQHYTAGKRGPYSADDSVRPTIKRSLSDGNILCESDTTIRNLNAADCQQSSEKPDKRFLLDSASDMLTCGSSICHCRQIYGGMGKDHNCDSDHICYDEHGDGCDCSNFLDVDWLSSSGNSCEEELLERSTSISSDNIVNELITETSASESGSSMKGRQSGAELNKDGKYTESFERWVTQGEMLFV
ncbi:SAC domain [Sesbania bispinosa]|nr:SAC domain [Sesbania bispinosa]